MFTSARRLKWGEACGPVDRPPCSIIQSISVTIHNIHRNLASATSTAKPYPSAWAYASGWASA